MSSQDIEACVKDLMAQLKSLAPKLRPQIFPSQFSHYAQSILKACRNENQRAAIVSFLASHDMDDESILFHTDIDLKNRKVVIQRLLKPSNPIDARIQSLEQLMKAFVTGSKEEMIVLNKRFLDANRLDGDSHNTLVSRFISSKCQLFPSFYSFEFLCPVYIDLKALQEVCTLAYTAKVFLSNMGMSIFLGDKLKLPFSEEDDENVIQEALRHLVGVDDGDGRADSGRPARPATGLHA